MGVYGLPWTPAVKIWHFKLTQDHLALRTPRVCGGHFVFFVPNPYNMGVYGLPWSPAIKIFHVELTQDHLETEDTEGNQRSLCPFCSNPLQNGCLLTPLDPTNQDLTF